MSEENNPSPDQSAQTPQEKIKQDIITVFKDLYDPEIPVNIYDLGMVYDIKVNENLTVDVTMTLTSPNCPAIETLPAEAKQRVLTVDGVEDATLELV